MDAHIESMKKKKKVKFDKIQGIPDIEQSGNQEKRLFTIDEQDELKEENQLIVMKKEKNQDETNFAMIEQELAGFGLGEPSKDAPAKIPYSKIIKKSNELENEPKEQ